MERVALTIWNDRISPVFDVSRQLLIVEIDDGKISQIITETFTSDEPLYKINKMKNLKIDTLICGAVSKIIFDMISTSGINVISFVSGKYGDIMNAYISGNLWDSDFYMPGYRHCHRHREFRRNY